MTLDEVALAIDLTVSQFLDMAGIAEPPVDPLLVAEALGIRAQRDGALSGRAEQRSVNGRNLILVRPDERDERECFAIAHEIGEALAVHRIADRLDMYDLNDQWRELLANQFAGGLLCPTSWLRDALPHVGDSIRALKAVFSTASHEVIARRMLQLDFPTVITIIDNSQITLRIGNVAHQARMTAFEDVIWKQCHDSASEIDCENGPFRVQGVAIHEDGWKREILRTTSQED